MLFLYNLSINIYHFLILIYQHFNTKARLWVEGRKNIFDKIEREVDPQSPSIWFHFASLGEFEQGRPVLESAKRSYPSHKIIVTFFSPSGYELRKNYDKADHVFYLPLDTNQNAERFVKLVNPALAIFTKYEFWHHYFHQLEQQNIPLIVISAIFRESQPFFKWYGGFHKKILGNVDHFFVQDENSRELLAKINLTNVTVSGDTRFDRVAGNAEHPKALEDIKAFCGADNVFVAGSTWPEDEKIIAELFKEYPKWKFIIAPHEIDDTKIKQLMGLTPNGVRYSNFTHTPESFTRKQILVIDNIGMLSALYQFANIAYIGGGFGVGIHNTLEAAAFGVPVIFGPNYQKFREAKALIELGAGFSIKDGIELKRIVRNLKDHEKRSQAGKVAKGYVGSEKGATEAIMRYLRKNI